MLHLGTFINYVKRSYIFLIKDRVKAVWLSNEKVMLIKQKKFCSVDDQNNQAENQKHKRLTCRIAGMLTVGDRGPGTEGNGNVARIYKGEGDKKGCKSLDIWEGKEITQGRQIDDQNKTRNGHKLQQQMIWHDRTDIVLFDGEMETFSFLNCLRRLVKKLNRESWNQHSESHWIMSRVNHHIPAVSTFVVQNLNGLLFKF